MKYTAPGPTRDEVDGFTQPTLLEFGIDDCPYCKAAALPVKAALAEYPDVTHLKVEDGKGRRLGRTFGVKLWPTLIFLKSGKEVARLVRPTEKEEIVAALQRLLS